MTTPCKFKKLDKRNTGWRDWKYWVEMPSEYGVSAYTHHQIFHEWREWCWATWGASKELTEWMEDCHYPDQELCHNPRWCWTNDNFNTRIYLHSDAEVTHFLLRWS